MLPRINIYVCVCVDMEAMAETKEYYENYHSPTLSTKLPQ